MVILHVKRTDAN